MATPLADMVVTGPNKPIAEPQPTNKLWDRLNAEAQQEWCLANDELLDFYRVNKHRLDEIDYEKVAATLSPIVAACFRGSTWKYFACALGIPDSELEGVEQQAEWRKLAPLHVALQCLYPALKACSKRSSLGHLVDILKEQGRLDVLNRISPQVKGFLLEPPCDPFCFEEKLHQRLEHPRRPLLSIDSGVSSLDSGDFVSGPTARNSILAGSSPKQAALPFQENSRNGGFLPEAFSSESNSHTTQPSFPYQDNTTSSLNNGECNQEEESICGSLIDKILPKTKLDKLTVLVSHLEEDIDLAQELARILEEEHECHVLTQAEILPAIHTDPTLIEDLIQKVNAIVPLVTRAYLDHYEHSRRTHDLNSADSMLTWEVYALSFHRLVSSSCLYYMLFPVRTPDVEYKEVRRHHIFSKSAVMCEKDLAQLVKNMHKCQNRFKETRGS